MALSVPRYPEFEDISHWSEKEQFYIPELEMVFGEVCSAMKKCWRGYKWARLEQDTELQEHYADIIQGIIEGLGYRPMTFHIVENYDMFASQEMIDPEQIQMDAAEAQEVDEIDAQVKLARAKRRELAIEYGKQFKRPVYNWDEITKQYVTYISPEDPEDQDFMLGVEDEEIETEDEYA